MNLVSFFILQWSIYFLILCWNHGPSLNFFWRIILFYLFISCTTLHVGSSSWTRELSLSHWKCGVLTTRSPRKVLLSILIGLLLCFEKLWNWRCLIQWLIVDDAYEGTVCGGDSEVSYPSIHCFRPSLLLILENGDRVTFQGMGVGCETVLWVRHLSIWEGSWGVLSDGKLHSEQQGHSSDDVTACPRWISFIWEQFLPSSNLWLPYSFTPSQGVLCKTCGHPDIRIYETQKDVRLLGS